MGLPITSITKYGHHLKGVIFAATQVVYEVTFICHLFQEIYKQRVF